MNKLSIHNHPRIYVTDAELETLLGSTGDSRYNKIKRLAAQDKLLHIRRGLYCLTESLGCITKPHPFELAQHIYGPSYISLESALAYHGLIPETVYSVTSACTKRSKEFHTPLGVYTYQHLPTENFYTEVELITENNNPFLIAKPWKAICDYIFCYKKEWNSLEPLLQSLRIRREDLPILRHKDIETLDEYYHHRRLSRFLKSLSNEAL